jgi:hypothetical protein
MVSPLSLSPGPDSLRSSVHGAQAITVADRSYGIATRSLLRLNGLSLDVIGPD